MQPARDDIGQPVTIGFEIAGRAHHPGNADRCPVIDLPVGRRMQPPVVVTLKERRYGPPIDLAAQPRPQRDRQRIADQVIHLGQVERRHRRC
ncbi:hypothetical protein D3C72_1961990 [compost metagenome]